MAGLAMGESKSPKLVFRGSFLLFTFRSLSRTSFGREAKKSKTIAVANYFFASIGIPVFACTPDLFPDLMAAAISKQDVSTWAGIHDIKVNGG
jgi:hypothetical protein